ncbi:MAG: hypothetical protein EA387_06365 [Nitriliruptor sp.]|nr:MAG: hypothetical protein EA387_06365 [Nitriliruptor sp.]
MSPSDAPTPASPRPARGSGVASAGTEADRARSASMWRGLDHAHMMQVELVVAVVLWGGLGWLADRALGSTPWGTVVGALVGYAAGLYLVWLRSQRMDAEDAAEAAGRAARAPGGDLRGA